MAAMEMRMTKRANSREPTADAQPGDVSVVLVVPKTSMARTRALSSDFISQTSVFLTKGRAVELFGKEAAGRGAVKEA